MTLLEVLVVIAIIGLLMGLLLPATMKMRHRARETKENGDRVELATAILAFHAEYGLWPLGDQVNKQEFPNADVIAALSISGPNNTKKKIFYEGESEIKLPDGKSLFVGINPAGKYPIHEGRNQFDASYTVYFKIH